MIVYVVTRGQSPYSDEIPEVIGLFPTANWANDKVRELEKENRSGTYDVEPHQLIGAFYYAHTAEFFREKNERELHDKLRDEDPEIVVHRRMV